MTPENYIKQVTSRNLSNSKKNKQATYLPTVSKVSPKSVSNVGIWGKIGRDDVKLQPPRNSYKNFVPGAGAGVKPVPGTPVRGLSTISCFLRIFSRSYLGGSWGVFFLVCYNGGAGRPSLSPSRRHPPGVISLQFSTLHAIPPPARNPSLVDGGDYSLLCCHTQTFISVFGQGLLQFPGFLVDHHRCTTMVILMRWVVWDKFCTTPELFFPF